MAADSQYLHEGVVVVKYQKLVVEMNDLLDSVARKNQKRQKKLKEYLTQFTNEERKLQKRLDNESNDELRLKLNKKLDLVKAGYELVESDRLAG